MPININTKKILRSQIHIYNYLIIQQAFAREMIIKEQSQDNELTVNVNYGPSNKWFRGFMKRHPELRIRMPDSIDRGRYGMANTTVINNHFQLLEKCLKDMG